MPAASRRLTSLADCHNSQARGSRSLSFRPLGQLRSVPRTHHYRHPQGSIPNPPPTRLPPPKETRPALLLTTVPSLPGVTQVSGTKTMSMSHAASCTLCVRSNVPSTTAALSGPGCMRTSPRLSNRIPPPKMDLHTPEDPPPSLGQQRYNNHESQSRLLDASVGGGARVGHHCRRDSLSGRKYIQNCTENTSLAKGPGLDPTSLHSGRGLWTPGWGHGNAVTDAEI